MTCHCFSFSSKRRSQLNSPADLIKPEKDDLTLESKEVRSLPVEEAYQQKETEACKGLCIEQALGHEDGTEVILPALKSDPEPKELTEICTKSFNENSKAFSSGEVEKIETIFKSTEDHQNEVCDNLVKDHSLSLSLIKESGTSTLDIFDSPNFDSVCTIKPDEANNVSDKAMEDESLRTESPLNGHNKDEEFLAEKVSEYNAEARPKQDIVRNMTDVVGTFMLDLSKDTVQDFTKLLFSKQPQFGLSKSKVHHDSADRQVLRSKAKSEDIADKKTVRCLDKSNTGMQDESEEEAKLRLKRLKKQVNSSPIYVSKSRRRINSQTPVLNFSSENTGLEKISKWLLPTNAEEESIPTIASDSTLSAYWHAEAEIDMYDQILLDPITFVKQLVKKGKFHDVYNLYNKNENRVYLGRSVFVEVYDNVNVETK